MSENTTDWRRNISHGLSGVSTVKKKKVITGVFSTSGTGLGLYDFQV